MKTEVFLDRFDNCNTYLVSTEKYCIIIDPANQYKFIEKAIGEKEVVGILLTHGHFDHFSNLKLFLEKTNSVCYLQKAAKEKIKNVDTSCARFFGIKALDEIDPRYLKTLSDGETLKLGDIEVKVMFTPGHTDCSVCYIIEDSIFTGDTLFKNTVGRCDLPTGNTSTLIKSMEKFKKLKKDYILYPGHDEATTLSNELKYNRYLK